MIFTTIFFALLLAAGLIFIFWPVWSLRRPQPQAAEEDAERLRREKRRALLLLRDLDFDYQTGKLLEGDYRLDRAQAEAQAVQLMHSLDRLDSPDEDAVRTRDAR